MGPSGRDSRDPTSGARLRPGFPIPIRLTFDRARLAALLVPAKPATDIISSHADSRASRRGAPGVSPLFPRKPSTMGDSLPSLRQGITLPRTQGSCPDASRPLFPLFLSLARPGPLVFRPHQKMAWLGRTLNHSKSGHQGRPLRGTTHCAGTAAWSNTDPSGWLACLPAKIRPVDHRRL